MLGFLEKSIKLESNVLFSVVDFKMRKDGSKLRNRGLKIDFVEHDVGFSVVLSKTTSHSRLMSDSRIADKASMLKKAISRGRIYFI